MSTLDHAQVFLAQSPDATFIVDVKGTIVFVSEQASPLLGYESAELVGQPIETLVPLDLSDKHVSLRKAFQKAPSLRPMGRGLALRARRKDGVEIPVEVSLSSVETPDGTLVAASLRDVAYRVEYERKLEAARDDSERANRAKSRFLAAASHDLRQPLQSLSAYLMVLNHCISDEEADEIVPKMETSLRAMGGLLDALLDISQLESGSIQPRFTEVDLQRVFDAVQANNEPAAALKGLELVSELAPLTVRSDEALLTRILDNFVSNAIRYTLHGTVRIGAQAEGRSVRIDVSDTGVGIPKEQIAMVFEEYYQLDNPTRDKGKGLGLGLAIVQRIATLLDHGLQVNSALGQGSTFTVNAPLAAAQAADSSEPSSTLEPVHDRKTIVLFVDDDRSVLDSMNMVLKIQGFDVITASDPDKAIEQALGADDLDVLVSDYRLPIRTGVDLVRQLRSILKREVPAILMTGDTSAEHIRAAGLPRCHVLHKPTNPKNLKALIESATAES